MPAGVSQGEFITIARVVKPQGRVGEVSAELFTDFPERFAERRHLFALGTTGDRRELELEDFWPHKGRMVLKFVGIDSIDDAASLAGAEIQIPREQRAQLEAGSFYVSDLVGCQVFASTGSAELRELGPVTDVVFGAGEAPLLKVHEGARELLIPFVERYTKSVDLDGRRIELVLPEGMLELDAPLSRPKTGRSAK
jgi:16S rRNA processing protein RimM